ncbi:MAG: S-layer homology domain-containing protein [Clostridia bacterium]|nr:S-layer homology domain-containing protein [Clostridia bacterium]
MKTSARFLAMLLAVVMIASAALSVSAFSDVTAGVDHATAISVLSQLGVIGGYEDGTFKPTQNVTRAEMAKLVYVLYTTFVDAGAGTVKFNDVKADNWAAGYISWCASKGIIGGYGDGNFGPSDNVTYDQALKMVCGALGYNDWDSALWPTDVRSKAIRELALNEGIADTVKGSDKLTRGQVAQIMYNALLAPMNETKITYVYDTSSYVDANGDPVEVKVPVEVAKTLAVDVWDFTEKNYTIGAVQQNADDEAIKFVGDSTWTELEDLGLEEYIGKTADLIGLQVNVVEKDEEILGATVKGSVVDNVTISYDKKYTTLTIDGVKYTVDNFNGEAKNQIAFYNADGTPSDVEVFDSEGVFTEAFKNIIWMERVTRVIDVDGDGIVDRFVMAPKAAYVVTNVKVANKVNTVYYKDLEGSATYSAPVANVTATLAKDDVFVAAKLNNTVYAEVVAPTTAYATKLSTKTITLNELGAVKYTDITIAGVADKTFAAADVLGADKEGLYWIYNGQVIKSDLSGTVASEYKIAILKEVVENDVTFDPVTMQDGASYSAVLIIDGVETTVTLKEVIVAGETKTAAQAYNLYKATTAGNGKRAYVYELVAAYTEDDGLYTLTINADLDGADNEDTTDVVEGTTYVKVDTPAAITYNASTGLYTVGSYKRVVLDDASVIFYTYEVQTGAAAGFIDLGKYTKANITAKSFEKALSDVAYLAYNETTKMYTLIAAVVAGEIEGASDDTVSYVNDGRLVLYAPEDSSEELYEGKTYNSYIFMDNATLTTKDAVLDTEVLAENANDTEEGKLYGWNPTLEVYEVINSGVTLNTVKGITITDVVEEGYDLIYTAVAGEEFKVDETVTIWGLGEDRKSDSYKQLTFAELAEMFELVKTYNEDENDGADLAIRAICIKYKDANDDYILSSIIVEIFEADEEGVVAPVNSTILNNYFGY